MTGYMQSLQWEGCAGKDGKSVSGVEFETEGLDAGLKVRREPNKAFFNPCNAPWAPSLQNQHGVTRLYPLLSLNKNAPTSRATHFSYLINFCVTTVISGY
jgi:hypothetical protein